MARKLNSAALSAAATLKGLSHGKKVLFLGLAAAAVMGLIWLVSWTSAPDLQVLYNNLAPEDAAAIMSRLKEKKIPYQVGSEGKAILAPRELIYELRLEMASQKLPQGSGVGFEIFDNTKLGMTEFVQNVNYQRALQGELARTIGGFDEVESCRVHIVMPSQSLFIEKEEPATASVVLKLRDGRTLGEGQIQGIVHLVSSSVSRLEPKNVTVVDSLGKILAGQSEQSEARRVSSDQLEYQEKVERNLENRIKSLLAPVVGPEKAIVRVACLLDFKREEKTAEQYQPDAVAVRSEQVQSNRPEGSEPVAEGVPMGVASLDDPAKAKQATSADSAAAVGKHSRVVNYEVSKVVSHVVEPVGGIKRISVAVVVDGNHQWVEGRDGKGKWEYVPRGSEEIQRLENLVKRVVNFDATRGDQVEVANMPFDAGPKPDGEQPPGALAEWLRMVKPYLQYGRYFVAILAILFGYRLILRPLLRWLTSGSGRDSLDIQVLKQLPMTVKELEQGYDSDQAPPILPRKRAMELIERDRERSVQLMRDWLKEGQS